jgi:hypothetical protein
MLQNNITITKISYYWLFIATFVGRSYYLYIDSVSSAFVEHNSKFCSITIFVIVNSKSKIFHTKSVLLLSHVCMATMLFLSIVGN